jgi:hypothetical protein
VTLRQDLSPDPARRKRGAVGQPMTDVLQPNTGLEVDCVDVRLLLEGNDIPAFIKGFVVIRSQRVLAVVAVYTSTV